MLVFMLVFKCTIRMVNFEGLNFCSAETKMILWVYIFTNYLFIVSHENLYPTEINIHMVYCYHG